MNTHTESTVDRPAHHGVRLTYHPGWQSPRWWQFNAWGPRPLWHYVIAAAVLATVFAAGVAVGGALS